MIKNATVSTEPENPKPTHLWLTSELASALRVTEETIRRAIRHGRIKARKVGRGWRVPDEEVQRIIREGLG